MNRLLDNRMRITVGSSVGTTGLLLLSLLLLAGCEPSSSAPGYRPGGIPGRTGGQMPGQPAKAFSPGRARAERLAAQRPNGLTGADRGGQPNVRVPDEAQLPSVSKPVDEKKQASETLNPLGPTVKVEQAGNTVELASMIIAAKANPFLDWLPKPLLPVGPPVNPGEPIPVGVAVDPFANVSILGVMYNAKSPIVLISAGGDQQTQLVRRGDLVTLETGAAKVIAIRSDSVDLVLLDGSKQTRTLTLPNIIGYSNASSTTNDGNSSGEGDTAPASARKVSPASRGPRVMSTPATGEEGVPQLGNLKKIVEQSLSPSAKDAHVDLQEP